MPRIRFMDGSRNLWAATASVLVSSTSAVGLPVSNTQHPDRSKVWRSTTVTSGHTIDIDLGSSQALTCVALANFKLVGSGVLNLRERGTGVSASTPNQVAVVSVIDRDTRTGFAFFSSTSARHWQLQFTNPTAATDYAEIGFVHLGTYFEPAQNILVPADVTRVDPTVPSESVDGQATFARRTKVFRGSWLFQEVPESELDTWRLNWDTSGVSGAFFQVLDTALPWTSWYARQTGEMGMQLGVLSRYTVGLPWQEVR